MEGGWENMVMMVGGEFVRYLDRNGENHTPVHPLGQLIPSEWSFRAPHRHRRRGRPGSWALDMQLLTALEKEHAALAKLNRHMEWFEKDLDRHMYFSCKKEEVDPITPAELELLDEYGFVPDDDGSA